MRFKVRPINKRFMKTAMALETVINSDPNFRFYGETINDISAKLTLWEVALGQEMVVDLLKHYLSTIDAPPQPPEHEEEQ